MIEAKSRWVFRETNETVANQLAKQLNITPLVAKLLVNRGIQTMEEAQDFLFPKEQLHNPFLLKDMDICVKRINEAVEKKEKIIVYGDYDADGVSSTVVLLQALKSLGAHADYYIPNRFTEGYGPNETAFRNIKAAGYDLLITVDNGITGIHEAKVAQEIGLDLIITDHHEIGSELPEAIAIIHPKRLDGNYPFKELAGVGVAYKVASALLEKEPEYLLPFVAIGTIADLVPLHGENRVIVKRGLEKMKESKNLGLLSLIARTSIGQNEINEESIGFSLAPRINAPGRMDSACICVQLFLTDSKEEADELSKEIDLMNQQRQEIVNDITLEAIELVEKTEMHQTNKVLVIGKSNWHAGVIGIVASRLVDKYYRPVIVLTFDEEKGIAKGSARSIPGFNIYENLNLCKDFLPHFGGHPLAAGMTLLLENVSILREQLNEQADAIMSEEDFVPITELDGKVALSDITVESVEQIQLLAPFGMGNPKPKLLIDQITIPNLRKVGANANHLKISMTDGENHLDGIAFDMGEYADHISTLSSVSVIGELAINEWNNIRKPQLFMKDVAVKEWQLFDFRGSKQLDKMVELIPEKNRKIIVFQEQTITKLNLAPFLKDIRLIQTVQDALDCSLDNCHILLVDMPPNEQLLTSLITKERISRIYAHFYQEETQFFRTNPTRDHFKWFYAFLLKQGVFDLNRYGKDLAKHRGWSNNTIDFMTEVFFELDFVTINKGIISIKKDVQKKDLSESKTFKKRQELVQLEKDLLFSSYPQLKTWFDRWMKLSSLEEEKVLWI
ncbi:single-stranded-DNA-specific exonuclease RecJ [Bacillus kwashiorkori]|uniref:single-stranded-DNA-specific exonuclease RecJ n=1 Tax=Bacillus kwashiorkori TaxID=1522318 RepID=UPI000786334D|nr:single-stranded-DNA-specific exonuclease RecJ [Bacillus kwashiorkori]